MQIQKRALAPNSVDETKIQLSNNVYVRARNAANDADVSLIKLDASDRPAFAASPYVGSNKILDESRIGAASGVASLDGSGKVPVGQLPNSIMEFQGVWNATTNSPSLADGTGNIGDVYRVSVAGTQNLGSGSQTFGVGDWVMYNGTIWQLAHAGSDLVQSVNGAAGVVVLDTDDISEGTTNLYYTASRFNTAFGAKTTDDLGEGTTNKYFTEARVRSTPLTGYTSGAGTVAATDTILQAIQKLNGNIAAITVPVTSVNTKTGAVVLNTDDIQEAGSPTNKYFTDARAKTAVVLNTLAGSQTDQAPSVSSVNTALGGKQNTLTSGLETLTLSSGDITAQYKDLAQQVINGTLMIMAFGVIQQQGVDYTLSVVSNKTRITFAGDLATGGAMAFVASDSFTAQYAY